MAARECHSAPWLTGLLVPFLLLPGVGVAGTCPAAVEQAVGALADAVTGPIRTVVCPARTRVVVRLAPPGSASLDVEVAMGADPAAFRAAGAFSVWPVLDAEWSSVPAPQVAAVDALGVALSARGGDLVRALSGIVEPPGFLPETVPTAPPPAAIPWIPLLGLLLLAVAGARGPPGTLRARDLCGLVALALALRGVLGLWGPLHVNGQGPLWLLGAWGRPELLATYGPGYPEAFTWIARLVPLAPDRAVFAANALVSAAVAPAGAWLATGLGLGRRHALLAGLLLACDPVTILGGPSESYYPAILACAVAGAGAAAAARTPGWRGALFAIGGGLLLAHAVRVHPLAWPLAGTAPVAALAIDWQRGLRAALGIGVVALGVLGLHHAELLAVWSAVAAQDGTGSVTANNIAPPGLGFWIAAAFAFAAARSLGPAVGGLLVVALPFVALDAATHRVFGQSALWHASYRHVVLAIPAVCAVGLVPAPWLQGRRGLIAMGLASALLVGSGASLYGARTTEQREYVWLRGALAELPAGCRVAWVDRAGRRVLTIPEHLVPGWSCGTTSGLAVRAADDLTTGLMPETCRAWYRSSLCSSAQGQALCDAAEATVSLEPLARARFPAAPSYDDLPYSSDPVEVVLSRVAPRPPTPPLAGVRVAVTVDDLPWVGAPAPGGRVEGTRDLVAGLAGVPATGFVNCARVSPGRPALALWDAAGLPLGNHQERHDDIDVVGLQRWAEGARTCHVKLVEWFGRPPAGFRYPYLRNGRDPAVRDAARAVITDELGQRVARVTIDNHEWKFGALYGAALQAGDAARAAALVDAYVAHLVAATEHAARFAVGKLGHDVDHVLLLHANALNAAHVGRALGALADAGVTFIPLEVALDHPVYALPDAYAGPGGISWLYRIAPVTPPAGWTFEEESWQALERDFGPL